MNNPIVLIFILRCNYRRILVVTDETTEKGTEESTADVI